MFANNYISTIVEGQLPDFIRADHPTFVTLLKKYYEYMEQDTKTLNVGKSLYDYMDVDTTRADLIKYFKTKIIPDFPEETELSKEKLIKAAKFFYSKKGTGESFKFLFRVLYGQEVDVYFPKEDVLRASDGKWKLPQAIRLSFTDSSSLIPGGNVNVFAVTANTINANGINFVAQGITADSYIRIGNERRKVTTVNALGDYIVVEQPFANTKNGAESGPGSSYSNPVPQTYDSVKIYKVELNEYTNFNIKLLEKKLGVGEISRTSCVIEKAVLSVDGETGREFVELYVSNVKRLFEPGENIVINYTDEYGFDGVFKSKIISLISNITLYRNRLGVVQTGRKYRRGDPVVLFGGLADSPDATKAIAVVNNVSTGSIESVSLLQPGYFFREDPNSLIRIFSTSGIGANVIISGIWDDGGANSSNIFFNTDAIAGKEDITLDAADYDFANAAGYANLVTTLEDAFSYEEILLGKIRALDLKDGGSFFEEPPTFDAISVYESDYSANAGFMTIPTGEFSDYNRFSNPPSIQINAANGAYSTSNGYYTGCRLFLDVGDTAHYAEVLDYIVEYPGNPSLRTKTLYLDRTFENNINQTNILEFKLYLDFRPTVRNPGKLGTILIKNGGIGYNTTNNVIQFIGTGYGANAYHTVDANGSITSITLDNRGEGYPAPPSIIIGDINTGGLSTGTGAILEALLLSDGEELEAETSDIGRIQDFRIINRGFDYANTPVTSLKIADILTDNLAAGQLILGGDSLWQGGVTNANATFRATVDEVYRPDSTNTVIRVFNYSGSINAAAPIKVATSTGNLTLNLFAGNATISFNEINDIEERTYPKFYGDGLAKANASFLNGLIQYNGFYLNTDGFLSADKKLQNEDYYHNYSYEVSSEKSLDDYKDTIYKVGHPAGMQLLSKFVMKDLLINTVNVSSNLHTSNTLQSTNGNTSYTSNIFYGNTSNFTTFAAVGDLIVINTTETAQFKRYTREITNIVDNNTLWLETPIGDVGDGRINVAAGNANVFIYANNYSIATSLEAIDNISFHIGNTQNLTLETRLPGTLNACGTIVIGNTTAPNATYFTSNVQIGSVISVNGELRRVVSITDNNNLTVNAAFTYLVNNKYYWANTIVRRSINDITTSAGNTILNLNSSIAFANANSLIYTKTPIYNVVSYEIIKING